jgi:conjugative relaxase-like TrwC/TraI family protein
VEVIRVSDRVEVYFVHHAELFQTTRRTKFLMSRIFPRSRRTIGFMCTTRPHESNLIQWYKASGNNAMLDYLQDKAGYSRIGHHGGADGRFIDAHDWTVASFFQHDSRNHDPHLHIHNTALNRVECSDGEIRTLDSRGIHRWRPAAAAVGERTTGEHLTRSMSARLAMRPDGKAREVLGIARELIEAVSSRDRAIGPKVAELAAQYEAVNGRAPKGKALDRLNRQASDKTRPAKSHTGETVHDQWCPGQSGR